MNCATNNSITVVHNWLKMDLCINMVDEPGGGVKEEEQEEKGANDTKPEPENKEGLRW